MSTRRSLKGGASKTMGGPRAAETSLPGGRGDEFLPLIRMDCAPPPPLIRTVGDTWRSMSLSLSLLLACAVRSHDLPDRFILNDEDNFAVVVSFGDAGNFSDEESFRACAGKGEDGEEKERDISLKYREMVPAMALTEPLYVEVAVGGVTVAVAVVSLVVVVLVSEATRDCRFLAHARRTASLRSSDSAVGRK